MDLVQQMRARLEKKKKKKRLDTDEVDSTHLQPDPGGMEIEGQEHFVLLD